MELEVRLKELLKQHSLDHHGILEEIARDVDCHRHTVRKLYHNEAKNPSLETLGKICCWLRDKKGVAAAALPDGLFGVRPEHLWQAVAAAPTVSIFLGEYQTADDRPLFAQRWISRRDAEAAANIVELLSKPANIDDRRPQVTMEYVPFRFAPKSEKIALKYLQEDAENARLVFDRLRERSPNYSAIYVGSQRVNYLLEYLVADLFHCTPFVRDPATDKVPFYFTHRKNDRNMPTCFGGPVGPPGMEHAVEPGIYFLDKDHNWTALPWRENECDSGIVIVVRDPGNRSMELALFGFTGRATLALSKRLTSYRDSTDPFWSPEQQSRGKQVGVYVCQVELPKEERGQSADPATVTKIIPLDPSILKETLRKRPSDDEKPLASRNGANA